MEYESELQALMRAAAGSNFVGLGGAIGSDGKLVSGYSGAIGTIIGGNSVTQVSGSGLVTGNITSSNLSVTGGSSGVVSGGVLGGISGGSGGGIIGGAL